MLRRSKRSVPRLDYKILHSIGDRVLKDETSISTSLNSSTKDKPLIKRERSSSCVVIKRNIPSIKKFKSLSNLPTEVESNSKSIGCTETVGATISITNTETVSTITSTGHTEVVGATISTESTDNNELDSVQVVSVPGATMEESINQLIIEESTISDDINDYISENPVEDDDSWQDVCDLEKLVKRVEEFRSAYRMKHKELRLVMGEETYVTKFGGQHDAMIKMMKDYILGVKDVCKKMKSKVKTDTNDKKAREAESFKFLHDEINRSISDIEGKLDVNCNELQDSEITELKEDIPSITSSLVTISKRFPELLLLKMHEDSYTDVSLDDLKQSYDDIMRLKSKVVLELKAEVRERELKKQEKFKEGKLNIKLAKFKGYSSTTDIYTFRGDFEKLHLRSTPKDMLPDLLKNNYLDESALCMVKSVTDINEIWKRLVAAYGDPKMMLDIKFGEVSKIDALSRSRDPEKIMVGLMKIINLMRDLLKLCKDHEIQNKLFHGDGLQRIMKIMGGQRVDRWLLQASELSLDDECSWNNLIEFLEKELKVQQRKILVLGKGESSKEKAGEDEKKLDERSKRSHYSHHNSEDIENLSCAICGVDDHVATMGPGQRKLVQYFACKRFVDMTCAERLAELKSKGFCFQCLLPGADSKKGKHKDGKCQRDFSCQNPSHQRYNVKKHVLVCNEHKATEENKKLLDEYKRRCILKLSDIPTFSKDIQVSFHAKVVDSVRFTELSNHSGDKVNDETSDDIANIDADDLPERAVYQLQTVHVDGHRYNIFYDNGCGNFVSRYKAVCRLGHSRATQLRKGPLALGGVGGIVTTAEHGEYKVALPLSRGGEATFIGVCLDQITDTFPNYPLQGNVENDIHNAFRETEGDPATLPKLPKYVGGDIDFMIGIGYNRYQPRMIFQMPSGLAIYKSFFKNADGGDGVVGGPHPTFNMMASHFNHDHNQITSFLCQQRMLYEMAYEINPDVSFLGYKDRIEDEDLSSPPLSACICGSTTFVTTRQTNSVDELGCEITYRCVKCRSCKSCREGGQTEAISIREEVEDDLIKRSIEVNPEEQKSTASLPFIRDPKVLAPNINKTKRTYMQQVRKLSKSPEDKEAVLKAERKLQDLGYVEWVKNLTKEQQQTLHESPFQNYIAWRVVFKSSSVTTPCRPVFDASQPTDSGYSFNDILAKGKNNLNSLLEIYIRWLTHSVGYHTDLKTMYNRVHLKESEWCFQRYHFHEELDPNKEPEEKVIKTVIYGVVSSGQLAQHCIRETANLSILEYPEVEETLRKDLYVDDTLSGEKDPETVDTRADQLDIVLSKGGFILKGITVSGRDPPEHLSEDGVSILVAGIRWYPKDDVISLNSGDLNFKRKRRGKKPAQSEGIPEVLTRRMCTSKFAELFDITGMFTPITCAIKLDLHDLCTRGLDWDDKIPDTLRPLWESNFQMLQELRDLKFQRAVIPPDAVDLTIDTVDFGDASKLLVCIVIYVRFKRRNGHYSCQLVLSRTRLVPDGMTQPRAELYAAMLNAHSGEIVKRALYKHHSSAVKLTDSQIVLHWVSNEERPLKQSTRNKVVEIRRFTNKQDWRYVESSDMLADKGTRRGCTLKDVDKYSDWRNGIEWLQYETYQFPMKTVHEIILSSEEVDKANKEVPILSEFSKIKKKNTRGLPKKSSPVTYIACDEVQKRYEFSNYVVDPNKHRFSQVMRIVAYILKFISALKESVRIKRSKECVNINKDTRVKCQSEIVLTENEIRCAEDHYFKLATKEVKHFLKEKQYSKISRENENGILIYTGRILPEDGVTFVTPMTEAMRDLASTTFFVPIVDKHSPIAYSIVSDIHWNNKVVKHSGNETMWRQVLKYVFIIEGREIVRTLKTNCQRCRYLAKRTIEVSMAPISKHNITVAPAFYITQMDLAGPFKAYSNHNKRSTIKIWIVVFCCVTTSTTSIKVMEDYSSTSFIQSFVRFSCDVGYPKVLLADAGSQFIKACDDIKLNFQDLKFKMHRDVSVELEVCPVGGHHMNGKVERKIQEIKKSLEKTVSNERLSILQWETVMSEIANSINDLPLALGNKVADFEMMDLITPNRLRLGRNNDRSPVGSLTITSNLGKILEMNERIFNTWFENWLVSHVPKLIPQPKWFKNDNHLQEGDIVLITKDDSVLSTRYQFGIVDTIEISKDGKSRKARIRYRNHNENVDRLTYRSVRKLVMIHPVDELDITQELHEVAIAADLKKRSTELDA